jgi:Carboxypeptidase regulatory-like domain
MRRFLTLLVLLAAAPAYAQVGRVTGTVTDDAGRPIRGATVTAENKEVSPSTITGSSDNRGKFSLLGLKRGNWLFTIQAPGFENAQTRLDVITVRPNPPLSIRLMKGLAPAPPGAMARVDSFELQKQLDDAAAKGSAGDIDGAVAIYRDVLAKVPALTTIHLQIGALLERKPDVPAALAEYQALAKLEPDNERARAAIERLSRR